MNKARIGLVLTAALILFTLFSCESPLLSTPSVPADEDGGSGRSAAIDGLIASHGERRSISLSWNSSSNATLYYVYKADSPLDTFVRCAETTTNQYKFTNVTPGSVIYYKVSSVSYDGTESSKSLYVKGTSLAQPFISDITDVNESSATVAWYMENASDDTYKNNLLYTVYCYNGSIEVAQLALDGSILTENKATFHSLAPNTRYEYQVEAYLRSDQSASEKSDRVDAATARRMRPAAPVNLRASRGTAKDKVELYFELPDMVDITLGESKYEPKPVYFKIYKRRYSESGRNEYEIANASFSSISNSFGSYVPGATVKWTDEKVNRGTEYEYQVQSYVDDTQKIITSDTSKASATGWALSEGRLSLGDVSYTFNENGTLYASAKLPLVFVFDPKGEEYDYSLVETIEPIGDGEDSLSAPIQRPDSNLTYDAVKSYVARMNLEQPTSAGTPGRGVYSYKVNINLNNETIDTVETIGKVEVSENTDPIVVEGFSVQDGYKDKFVFKWHNHANRKYVISMSDDRTIWEEIDTVNPNPIDNSTDKNDNYSHTYTASDIKPGITKYFAIRPYRNVGGDDFKQGQMVYANAVSQTLGEPVLSLSGDGPSYSEITVAWPETQKADTYRIKYWYTEGAEEGIKKTVKTVKKSELKEDVNNRFSYSFSPFENNTTDAAKAGLNIQVEVDALNEGLRAEVGGGEIATTSKQTVATRLVGPALLNPSASHAASTTEINVSWDKTSGASGYYVFRRQFNMNNTAQEGAETVVYYVPEVSGNTSSITITGKNLTRDSSNVQVDTDVVKAAASFSGSRYTLTDTYMSDTEYYYSDYSRYMSHYKDQQNDMAQGYSYRYAVVPVVNRGGAPEPLASISFVYAKDGSNKNTGINYYTIQEKQENGVNTNIRYNGAAAFEKDGFTIGFGQDVTATKGTYASSGNTNNGIQIRWSLPAKLAGVAGFSPRFTVYRRASGGAQWDTVTSVDNALQYVDLPDTRGIAYEYVVGIANGLGTGSQPKDSRRFIERCGTLRDERGRPNYLGFMLDNVRMVSVSRDSRKVGDQFAEEVKWRSAGVSSSYSSGDYNWGVDGYTIYLLNRNVNNNRQWIAVADVPTNGLPNQIDQSRVVANDATNFLKVLRDYRHYFKVRSYVSLNGEKVYGPDPAESYMVADGTDTEYVKWGARQISADEFAAITALSIGTALNWWANPGNVPDRNWNGGHNVNVVNNNTLGYQLNMDFSNSKPYFVTINGRLHGRVTAQPRSPEEYGCYGSGLSGLESAGSNQKSTLTFTGPGDVNGMYAGTVTILRMKSNSGAGDAYRVSYNGQDNIAVDPKHYRNNFTFNAGNKNDFKVTKNFDWSPGGGFAGTSPDKWWYPINGSRAGWD